MFGHVTRTFYTDPFSIIKVAAGGSEIKKNWSKESGSFWPELLEYLVEPIDTTTEAWKGIVWFQGENDSSSQTTSSGYLVELTNFIANLRYEMYNVDTTTFAQPSDIPVVIIGLGCWIAKDGGTDGKAVMDAQKAFVNATPNTALVPTDDLSCHYHFDDASQIIIGARLANTMMQFSTALTPTLSPVNTLATPSPTSTKLPTPRPTKVPPTPRPTKVPSTPNPTRRRFLSGNT